MIQRLRDLCAEECWAGIAQQHSGQKTWDSFTWRVRCKPVHRHRLDQAVEVLVGRVEELELRTLARVPCLEAYEDYAGVSPRGTTGGLHVLRIVRGHPAANHHI